MCGAAFWRKNLFYIVSYSMQVATTNDIIEHRRNLAAAGGSTEAAAESAAPPQPENLRECAVCLEGPPTWVIGPCGHAVLCDVCADHPKFSPRTKGSVCPICKGNCNQLIRIFWA